MTPVPSTLLVEDNDALADSLASALTDAGVLIERARTWDEGLQRFRVTGHLLVIADYNLPGSEHGLLLLLQAKQLIPTTKLVLISGALSPVAERNLSPGDLIDAYFRKDSNLASNLLPWVENAMKSVSDPTDWQLFASGTLVDPDAQRKEAERIDSLLRADVDRDE